MSRKSNEHKKMTFEDKFSRRFACWVKNNRDAWHFWKRKNRRDYRHMKERELHNEINKGEE